MTDTVQQKTVRTLKDSAAMRWTALGVVAFTMMAAYYVNDVMAPLQEMLEAQLGWTGSEFGFFTGAYSFLNVFLLMLIWGGLIIDRFGVRFTGKLAAILMVGRYCVAILRHNGAGRKRRGDIRLQDRCVRRRSRLFNIRCRGGSSRYHRDENNRPLVQR